MHRSATVRFEGIPPWAAYVAFGLLSVAATAPVWRPLLFGLSVEDWLQLRCF
ncbi:hypothetical protein ACVILH_004306 [Bradyrhizobium sp. USDA 4353]